MKLLNLVAETDSRVSTATYTDADPEAAASMPVLIRPALKVTHPKTIQSERPRAPKTCTAPECESLARSRGLCKAHGGGKRCVHHGCQLSDQGGGFCIRHGGGKRCEMAGCMKSAQSRGFCKAHGGGLRCKVESCPKSSQGGGFCRTHGGGPKRNITGSSTDTGRRKSLKTKVTSMLLHDIPEDSVTNTISSTNKVVASTYPQNAKEGDRSLNVAMKPAQIAPTSRLLFFIKPKRGDLPGSNLQQIHPLSASSGTEIKMAKPSYLSFAELNESRIPSLGTELLVTTSMQLRQPLKMTTHLLKQPLVVAPHVQMAFTCRVNGCRNQVSQYLSQLCDEHRTNLSFAASLLQMQSAQIL